MNNKISQRYQKALVTVAMGLRTEDDIRKNGLYRFLKNEKDNLINYITNLYSKNKSVLALKIKQNGYRSEHINITNETDLQNFIINVDNIFELDNEIWVVSNSVVECWRCRMFISDTGDDFFEMAYSFDDHILDHLDKSLKIPYAQYSKKGNLFVLQTSNLNDEMQKSADFNINNILSKYSRELHSVREDLKFIGINGISLDIRINNGYDFHDFDVAYEDVEKVVNYYLQVLNNSHVN